MLSSARFFAQYRLFGVLFLWCFQKTRLDVQRKECVIQNVRLWFIVIYFFVFLYWFLSVSYFSIIILSCQHIIYRSKCFVCVCICFFWSLLIVVRFSCTIKDIADPIYRPAVSQLQGNESISSPAHDYALETRIFDQDVCSNRIKRIRDDGFRDKNKDFWSACLQ
jgi:hypothetical protein